jgi:hypothetical protein
MRDYNARCLLATQVIATQATTNPTHLKNASRDIRRSSSGVRNEA